MAEIRPYQDSDYPAVHQNMRVGGVYDEVRDSQKNLDSMVAQDPESVLVAELDGEVVGSIMFSALGKNLALIWGAVVAEQHRRAGIAKQLIATVENTLRARGVVEIWCFIDTTNEASLASADGSGYKHTGRTFFGPKKPL